MQNVKHFIIITQREYLRKYIELLKETDVERSLTKLCNGTATDNVLDCLGVEKTEKVLIEGLIRSENVSKLNNALINEMNIEVPGNGIAIYIPVDGIGGVSAKTILLGKRPIGKKEKEMEKGLSKLVLIMAIVDRGYSESVMDSAREAGATGGTVVKANGTGTEMAKFFGIQISAEKDMVYIVSKRENRDDIMYAIMEKAGVETEAHGVVFSLPVDSVVGIRSFENF